MAIQIPVINATKTPTEISFVNTLSEKVSSSVNISIKEESKSSNLQEIENLAVIKNGIFYSTAEILENRIGVGFNISGVIPNPSTIIKDIQPAMENRVGDILTTSPVMDYKEN